VECAPGPSGRAEACRRVGKDARDLGVGWATIMRAVDDHRTPLVDDPTRLDGVGMLGLDETSFLKATRLAPTRYVTGLVDLEQGRLLDVVADRTRAAVDRWLGARTHDWMSRHHRGRAGSLARLCQRAGRTLSHARVAVDHFHAIKLANTVVDQVRRRTQQATLGHRGRKGDPLYRIRSCCWWPPSSSVAGDECGCGLGWRLEILVVRWPRPGRARNCCAPSTPAGPHRPGPLLPLGRRRPGP
jgi:hypothetical protein